jgi:hypothetical protein
MTTSTRLYDLLGAGTYLPQLSRTDLEDIVRSAGHPLKGMIKASLIQVLIDDPEMARRGLAAI